ncbi:hypothetical protein ACVWZR_004151 [Bradyrhizobium sp. i1.3.1]
MGTPSVSSGHRRRGGRAADQRNRGDAGETLELDARNRVLANRRGVVEHHQRHDLARIIQLDRQDLARGNTVEIDRPAAAQAAGGAALEHHAQLAPALGGAPFLHAEHAAERHGDDRQRRRSDYEVARACHAGRFYGQSGMVGRTMLRPQY